eukprot:UN07221
MCSPTQCSTCGKTTWSGCGRHIDSALRSVPYEERCACKSRSQKEHDENGGSGDCSVQ